MEARFIVKAKKIAKKKNARPRKKKILRNSICTPFFKNIIAQVNYSGNGDAKY
jgi:hypothetical protein